MVHFNSTMCNYYMGRNCQMVTICSNKKISPYLNKYHWLVQSLINFSQILSYLTIFHYISPNVAILTDYQSSMWNYYYVRKGRFLHIFTNKSHQIASNRTDSHQVHPNLTRSHHISLTLTKFCKSHWISPFIYYSHTIETSNFAWKTLIGHCWIQFKSTTLNCYTFRKRQLLAIFTMKSHHISPYRIESYILSSI